MKNLDGVPVNKLAALVTHSGWKHVPTPVPDAVLERAQRQRLITSPPDSLLQNENFVNFIGSRVGSCRVLGLRADFGPVLQCSQTRDGWLWVLWCERCNSVFTRRCRALLRIEKRDGCPENCRRQSEQAMRASKGHRPKCFKQR